MPHVVALYRYPVKSFTPEACDALTVQADGRIVGDRVLGFRFANSDAPEDAWSKKHEFIALVNTPGLARLKLRYDHKNLRLHISEGNAVLKEECLDEAGRKRISAWIENYVLSLEENPLSTHSERLPLQLVGDGITPRFQDNEAGQITLHSRESLAAVATAVGDPNLSNLRFRSNIVIEGVEAWDEQQWLERKLRIGQVIFNVVAPKGRCLATHANPNTGERDLPVLQTLLHEFKQTKPTFAVGMLTDGIGGEICLGDEVILLDGNKYAN